MSKRISNPQKIEKPKEEVMTMVIAMGKVGKKVKELTEDVKVVLSPYTYPKLKASSKNRLHDFIENASSLDATMLMRFYSSLSKTSLEICRFPRGPTVYFNVLQFSNISDVKKEVERSVVYNKAQRSEPFLILDGFTESHEDKVMASMFQGLFPSLKIGQIDVSTLKRAVFISKDSDNVISIRHYKVQKRDLRISKGFQAFVKKPLPDLSGYETVDDFILSTGITETNKPKTAIQLLEIGPRIDITLKSIETGLFGGMKMPESESFPKHFPKSKNPLPQDDEEK